MNNTLKPGNWLKPDSINLKSKREGTGKGREHKKVRNKNNNNRKDQLRKQGRGTRDFKFSGFCTSNGIYYVRAEIRKKGQREIIRVNGGTEHTR